MLWLHLKWTRWSRCTTLTYEKTHAPLCIIKIALEFSFLLTGGGNSSPVALLSLERLIVHIKSSSLNSCWIPTSRELVAIQVTKGIQNEIHPFLELGNSGTGNNEVKLS
jgi:hypothetical protein